MPEPTTATVTEPTSTAAPTTTPTPTSTAAADGAKPGDTAAPTAKVEDGKPAATTAPTEPVKYEFKVPDGSPLSPARLEKIEAYAKAQGLSAEAAQALVEREHEAVSEYAADQHKQLEESSKAWAETALKDPEIGGEALPKNLEMSKRVFEQFGSKALVDMLEKSGLGNHPEVVRLGVKLGKAMAEDVIVNPNATKPAERKPNADVFSPSTTENAGA